VQESSLLYYWCHHPLQILITYSVIYSGTHVPWCSHRVPFSYQHADFRVLPPPSRSTAGQHVIASTPRRGDLRIIRSSSRAVSGAGS